MKRADGEETQRKIVLAALELFVREGYHGRHITNIMRKVRMTTTDFCSHFNSKSQLLLEIITKYTSWSSSGEWTKETEKMTPAYQLLGNS